MDRNDINCVSRRNLLRSTAGMFSAAAIGGLLPGNMLSNEWNQSSSTPHAGRGVHFPPKAKRVIYLHMVGAPSQLDLFEHKPMLAKHDGEVCPKELLEGKRFAFIGGELRLSGSPYAFKQHGQSGHTFSELLPHLATVADDLAFVHSMHAEEINHAPAQMFLHTGFGRGGRPSFGSWLNYGLGSMNKDLPAFVTLLSGGTPGAGTSLWSAGFIPSVYQGIQFRSKGDAVLFLTNPDHVSRADRRTVLDAIQTLNNDHFALVGDPEIQTRNSQYDMAYRMQASVPDLMNFSEESKETLELYGAEPGKASFANNCLLARRLIERDVRVVELFDSDWDHHSDIRKRLKTKCKDVDKACAALITDLKQRGLLDDTLVVWTSEFGRTPLAQGADSQGKFANIGRDHHKDAFTCWLAGAGIKAGASVGATDDFGFNVVENPVHVHDFNATILHLLGIDHERLTYRYQGRDFRLTDVHGHVVKGILA